MSIIITAVVALALGFVAAFALLLGGYWKAPEQLKQQILALPGALWSACRTGLKRIKQTVLAAFRKQHALPVKFRDWVARDLGDHPALQAWLLSLPEPGFQALTQGTVRYCVDLKIELSWLAERHVDVAPAVQQAVKAIVVDYLQGCWQAVCHKDGIALFGIYHQLAANLADSRQIDLRRRLFTRLAASGLSAPVPPYELIMASERQRQALAAEAIREAATKDWDTFAKLLAELLTGDGEDPPPGPAASTPAANR